MADKMTNVKALAYVLENYDLPDEISEKVKAMKASYEKRNASKAGKPSKKAAENAEIAERVMAWLLRRSRARRSTASPNSQQKQAYPTQGVGLRPGNLLKK